MTPEEELFQKFFNAEKIIVANMDIIQLRTYREELSKVAFEAKARLVAVDDEVRTKTARTKNAQWLTLVTGDQTSSDAINAVETRKKRMSKMDKLRADLQKAGIAEETIKEMIGNLEKTATEKKLDTITFNVKKEEITAVTVEKREEQNKTPFDPSTLFGDS